MKLPLSIGSRHVLVEVAAADVTIGELVTATAGAEPPGRAVTVNDRILGLDVATSAARLRPGDDLQQMPGAQRARQSWAVHVLAGVDAGLVVPLPEAVSGVVTVTIGRRADMTVSLRSNGVSGHHCTLAISELDDHLATGIDRAPTIRVTDHGSRNGTVVHGRRVTAETVVAVAQPIRCGPTVIAVRPVVPADPPQVTATLLHDAASGSVPFYRSPVDHNAPQPEAVPVPPPPRRPRSGRPGLIGLLVPLALAGVMVRITGQWFYAVFALMGPLMMLISSVDRGSRNRRVRKRSRRRYQQELREFADELDAAVDEELGRRRAMYPDGAEVLRRADTASALLWSRRADHPEFMHLALGITDVPWEPPIDGNPEDLVDLQDAIDARRMLPLAPFAVPVTPGITVGLTGDRDASLATARSLLAQAGVMHGPAEIRVAIVCAAAAAPGWEWVKWLPHARPTFASGRILAAVADSRGQLDPADLDAVMADVDANAVLLVMIDSHGLADSGDLAVRRLLRRAPRAAGIVVADRADGLPDHTDVVVDHQDVIGEAVCRWPKEGGRSEAIVAAGMPADVAERVARRLARLADPDAGGGSASLPWSIGHAQLLGLGGARPADVQARWAAAGRWDLLVGLGEDGPVRIDLDDEGPHVLIAGARAAGKTEYLAGMVLSLCAEHPPEALHVVLWGESFTHLHRLPHVAGSISRIDDASVSSTLDALERELTRRERLRTNERTAAVAAARLVVVIDDVDIIMRTVPLASERMVRVFRRARGAGIHVLWSASRHMGGVIMDLIDLTHARVVLRTSSTNDSNELLGAESAAHLERSLPGRGYVVTGRTEPREVHGGAVSSGAPRPSRRVCVSPFDLANSRRQHGADELGAPDERPLVALIAAAGATSTRPTDLLSSQAAAATVMDSPGLLELLGLDGPGGMSTVTDDWHTIDADSFLRVPIGIDTEMRPVLLDLKESALAGMGPHGLLVGATGSGKSELLRTLVCGLALTHAPEALSFVLVDFKGGASFATLGALPHVAGVVTNLADDLALVDRILAALGGEQRRRQELLARAGNLANVREYRAARAAGTLPPDLHDEPLPQLLVIVDEFAELLDQEPAFIDFFLTIGRVGRSLGIHLLLASQRLEEGKLRGLDTYLSYRLGLRTFSATESRTVLGVPDAYSLPAAPGGGYLKVGSTSFERFQASYVSGLDDSGGTVLDAVIDRLSHVDDTVHQIWLPPLEPAVALDRVFPAGFVHDEQRGLAAAAWPGTGTLTVPVGIVDDPSRQRQLPLVLDMAGACGNLAIAGAPQSGKSTLVRSLMLSLAVTHTPEEVQIYGVDLGGGALSALAGLPHVGTIATRLDNDLVRRMIAHIEALLDERERVFTDLGLDSVVAFRARRGEGTLPVENAADVVLVIDGWAAFRERYEHLEPVIADLVSRGLGYGIHVVLTANRWMEVRATVLDSIGGRLELRLNSAIDSNVDRKRAAVIRADQPGRGLHPSTLLFHTALPRLDGVAGTDQLADATAVAVAHITERWSGPCAEPVRLLPTEISIDAISTSPASASDGVLVGLTERKMAPWTLDLSRGEPHFSVYGDGESGRTTFLHTWLDGVVAAQQPEQAQIVLVDYRRTLLDVVPPSHLRAYAASEPATRDVIGELAEVLHDRLPGSDVTAAQLRDRSWWSGPTYYVVIDDYDLVVTASGNPLAPLVPLLAQARDVGLHVVLTRRVAGSSKSAFEPFTSRLREVSPFGLIMAGDRDEGPVLGSVRASPQPPGRGVLVSRRHSPALVQVALPASVPALHLEPAAESVLA